MRELTKTSPSVSITQSDSRGMLEGTGSILRYIILRSPCQVSGGLIIFLRSPTAADLTGVFNYNELRLAVYEDRFAFMF